jgi:hypothetical protein
MLWIYINHISYLNKVKIYISLILIFITNIMEW